jgi:hypothetical protein
MRLETVDTVSFKESVVQRVERIGAEGVMRHLGAS